MRHIKCKPVPQHQFKLGFWENVPVKPVYRVKKIKSVNHIEPVAFTPAMIEAWVKGVQK